MHIHRINLCGKRVCARDDEVRPYITKGVLAMANVRYGTEIGI